MNENIIKSIEEDKKQATNELNENFPAFKNASEWTIFELDFD